MAHKSENGASELASAGLRGAAVRGSLPVWRKATVETRPRVEDNMVGEITIR
jgi:hypothetical protein